MFFSFIFAYTAAKTRNRFKSVFYFRYQELVAMLDTMLSDSIFESAAAFVCLCIIVIF